MSLKESADRLFALSGDRRVSSVQVMSERETARSISAINAYARSRVVLDAYPDSPVALDFYNQAVKSCHELGINIEELE